MTLTIGNDELNHQSAIDKGNDLNHCNSSLLSSFVDQNHCWLFIIRLALASKICNKMNALTQDFNRARIQKEFAWLVATILMIAGLPLLKNALMAILTKLYEMFIQRGIGR